jgi:hypothetical protein
VQLREMQVRVNEAGQEEGPVMVHDRGRRGLRWALSPVPASGDVTLVVDEEPTVGKVDKRSRHVREGRRSTNVEDVSTVQLGHLSTLRRHL